MYRRACFFFFSSRRRHTRLTCDWSSDVCSSDLAPDVAFVSRQRFEAVGEPEGYWPGAPDVAVEVISPHDRYTEVADKVVEWLEAGSRMVVVVNPRQRSVTVYHSRTDIVMLTEEDTSTEARSSQAGNCQSKMCSDSA